MAGWVRQQTSPGTATAKEVSDFPERPSIPVAGCSAPQGYVTGLAGSNAGTDSVGFNRVGVLASALGVSIPEPPQTVPILGEPEADANCCSPLSSSSAARQYLPKAVALAPLRLSHLCTTLLLCRRVVVHNYCCVYHHNNPVR